jgi:hypothetical protein
MAKKIVLEVRGKFLAKKNILFFIHLAKNYTVHSELKKLMIFNFLNVVESYSKSFMQRMAKNQPWE